MSGFVGGVRVEVELDAERAFDDLADAIGDAGKAVDRTFGRDLRTTIGRLQDETEATGRALEGVAGQALRTGQALRGALESGARSAITAQGRLEAFGGELGTVEQRAASAAAELDDMLGDAFGATTDDALVQVRLLRDALRETGRAANAAGDELSPVADRFRAEFAVAGQEVGAFATALRRANRTGDLSGLSDQAEGLGDRLVRLREVGLAAADVLGEEIGRDATEGIARITNEFRGLQNIMALVTNEAQRQDQELRTLGDALRSGSLGDPIREAATQTRALSDALGESIREARRLDDSDAGRQLAAEFGQAQDAVRRYAAALRTAGDDSDRVVDVAPALLGVREAFERIEEVSRRAGTAVDGELFDRIRRGASLAAVDVDRLEEAIRDADRELRGSRSSTELDDIADAARRAAREVDGIGRGIRDLTAGDIFRFESFRQLIVNPFINAAEEIPRIIGRAITTGVTNAADVLEGISLSERIFGDFDENGEVIRDFSGILRDFAATSADAFGLAERDALQFGSQLGASLQNLGFDTRGAAEESTRLLALSADLASAFNTDVTPAVEAFAALLRGEVDPIEKYGVTIKQTEINQRALADGLAESAAELTSAQKAQVALTIAYEQTNRVQNDFRDTASELPNLLRRIGANATDLSASFGQSLLPTFRDFALVVNELVSGDDLAASFDDLGAALQESLGPVADELLVTVGSLPEFISAIAPDLSAVIGDLGGIFADLLPPLMSLIEGGLSLLAPALEVISGVVEGLAPGLQAIGQGAEFFGDVLGPLAAVLSETATIIGPILLPAIIASTPAFASAAVGAFGLSAALQALRTAALQASRALVTALANPVVLAAGAVLALATAFSNAKREAEAFVASIGIDREPIERIALLNEEIERLGEELRSTPEIVNILLGPIGALREGLDGLGDKTKIDEATAEIERLNQELENSALLELIEGQGLGIGVGDISANLEFARAAADGLTESFAEIGNAVQEARLDATGLTDPIREVADLLQQVASDSPEDLLGIAAAVQEAFGVDIGDQFAFEELLSTTPRAVELVRRLGSEVVDMTFAFGRAEDQLSDFDRALLDGFGALSNLSDPAAGLIDQFSALDDATRGFVTGFLDENFLAAGTRFVEVGENAITALLDTAGGAGAAVDEAFRAAAFAGLDIGPQIVDNLQDGIFFAAQGVDVSPIFEAINGQIRQTSFETDPITGLTTVVTTDVKIDFDPVRKGVQGLSEELTAEIQRLAAFGQVSNVLITDDGPILETVGSVEQLTGAYRALFEELTAGITPLQGNGFTDGIANGLLRGASGQAVDAGNEARDVLDGVRDEIAEVTEVVGSAVEGIGSAVKDTTEAAVTEIEGMGEAIGETATDMVPAIDDIVEAFDDLRDGVDGDLTSAGRIIDSFADDVTAAVRSVERAAEGFRDALTDPVRDGVRDAARAAGDIGPALRTSMTPPIVGAAAAVGQSFSDELLRQVERAVTSAREAAEDALSSFSIEAEANLNIDITGRIANLSAFQSGLSRTIELAIEAAFRSAVANANTPGATNNQAGAGGSFSPGFASGGLITRQMLALVGEGGKRELILPLTDGRRTLELASQHGLFDILARELGRGATTGGSLAAGGGTRFTLDLRIDDADTVFGDAGRAMADSFVAAIRRLGVTFEGLPQFARGGIFDRATVGVFGEAGPEALVPMGAGYRREAMAILSESGLGAMWAESGRGQGSTMTRTVNTRTIQAPATYNQVFNITASVPRITADEVARRHREQSDRDLGRLFGRRG